jgi:biopolymer transport protein ExbB
MIPLAFCSIAGLTVIIERSIGLRTASLIPTQIIAVMQAYKNEDSVPTVEIACKTKTSPLSRIAEALLEVRNESHSYQVETLNAVGRREVERMERGLLILEIVAGVSPLLGLLGTVLGMVTVFDAVTAQGLGDAQVLSEGISKALITTITGLTIAIPSMAFHSYYMRRVDSLASQIHEYAARFVVKLSGSD